MLRSYEAHHSRGLGTRTKRLLGLIKATGMVPLDGLVHSMGGKAYVDKETALLLWGREVGKQKLSE